MINLTHIPRDDKIIRYVSDLMYGGLEHGF